MAQSGIVLYTVGTPNGVKISIALEELKALGLVDYTTVPISFIKNEQKEPWFLAINPNGRIPAIVDHLDPKDPINVWESASILLYLGRVYDKDHVFNFASPKEEQEMLNWIFFLQGGVGPMQGQANHFFRYAPEKIPYGINRYQTETRRLYGVYEERLNDRDYLVGAGRGKYSYADICTVGWVRAHDWAGISIDPFPNLAAWLKRIEARPAVQLGLKVPHDPTADEHKSDPKWAEKKAEEARQWIMKGMQDEENARKDKL